MINLLCFVWTVLFWLTSSQINYKNYTQKLNGGTTVAATMMAAYSAGIKIFVTGGVGGVHRDVLEC